MHCTPQKRPAIDMAKNQLPRFMRKPRTSPFPLIVSGLGRETQDRKHHRKTGKHEGGHDVFRRPKPTPRTPLKLQTPTVANTPPHDKYPRGHMPNDARLTDDSMTRTVFPRNTSSPTDQDFVHHHALSHGCKTNHGAGSASPSPACRRLHTYRGTPTPRRPLSTAVLQINEGHHSIK